MWSLISRVVAIIAKLLGVGQPDPVAQGEKLGQAETEAQADDRVLKEVGEAEAARGSVSTAPDELRKPGPWSRD